MKRIDIMLDLETLSLKPKANVIQISAVAFDIKTGDILDVFDQCCSVTMHRISDRDTLDWWEQTNPDLLQNIIARGVGVSQMLALGRFVNWVQKLRSELELEHSQVFLWGNGVIFDNCKIQDMCEQFGIAYPIHYKCDQDMRTLNRLYKDRLEFLGMQEPLELEFVGTEHDALDDCKNQIKAVVRQYNFLVS